MLTAEQVVELQNSQPPTDWSKFDQQTLAGDSGGPGGLPPGMGPGHDDKLHVRFFMRPVIDVEASNEANRPIYKDVPHITIMIPGDKNNIPTSIVDELHKRRFPKHWDMFLRGLKEQIVGTPLRMAPFISESKAEELAYFNIRTIEQLADMPDGNLSFMGARELKNAAKAYLDKSKSADAMLDQIRELQEELAAMRVAQQGKPAKA